MFDISFRINLVPNTEMSDPGHDSGQEGSSGDAIQIQTDRNSDSEDAVILEEEIRGPIENLPKIGEPSKNYDVRDSVCYSHNWFYQKTVDGVPYAVCRLCEKEESGSEQKSGAEDQDDDQQQSCYCCWRITSAGCGHR